MRVLSPFSLSSSVTFFAPFFFSEKTPLNPTATGWVLFHYRSQLERVGSNWNEVCLLHTLITAQQMFVVILLLPASAILLFFGFLFLSFATSSLFWSCLLLAFTFAPWFLPFRLTTKTFHSTPFPDRELTWLSKASSWCLRTSTKVASQRNRYRGRRG